jgi:hypothetical protein
VVIKAEKRREKQRKAEKSGKQAWQWQDQKSGRI